MPTNLASAATAPDDRRAQIAADLVWALSSRPFVEGESTVPSIAVDPNQLDTDHLTDWMAEHGGQHRVGQYFERLVHYWLLHVESAPVLAASHQIRSGKRTIGELDFVFRNRDAVVEHWEVAVKFFLHDPSRERSAYPGPNASDDFETKITKLFDAQLPRSKDFEPAVGARRALVRGCCFHHPSVPMPITFPDRMPLDCERGTWLRASELDLVRPTTTGSTWVIMEKPYWLTPRVSLAQPHGPLMDELQAHFATRRSARMVAEVDGTGSLIHRFCVVADDW